MQGLKDELFDLLQAKGARLMGVADLKGIAGGELTTGVSVAGPGAKRDCAGFADRADPGLL